MILSARSSSVLANQPNNWGPKFAHDGKKTSTNYGLFFSDVEDNPWLELKLKAVRAVSAIEVANRAETTGDRLQKTEIRAGTETVPGGFKGKLTINSKVAYFEGPGQIGATYRMEFDVVTSAQYITIQNLYTGALLSINEVTVFKGNLFIVYRTFNLSNQTFRNPANYHPCQ